MENFAENMFKKRKIEELMKIFECCICGESGHIGFTDTFQISLRENDYCLSFIDVIFFTVGINVQKDSSDICSLCKPKIIEFYHFKKRSQSIQKRFSPLLQEIMKIVGNYVSQNSIKAVTIEESKEKLVIMEKTSSENTGNLLISEVSSICDVQVKKEPDSSDGQDIEIPEIEIDIKKEPQELEEEIYELPDNSIPHTTENLEENSTNTEPNDKLDMIFNLNKEILEIVKQLNDQKCLNNKILVP
ncbi:unnamed protein product [Chironomus riparius]|uniref:ZAD domain-containing protein n=1 Tax=Chironomus riparius TaxID=315576 RepID=A0A9N9S1W4_9DIPT|nr:unnamed protein product [Chironomus riparius]